MTAPLWVSILVGVVAGIFGGVISPLITSWLSRRTWRRQRRFELKYEVFRGACAALAALKTDALDPSLQKQTQAFEGVARQVELRPETSHALEHHRGLIRAFFSADVVAEYEEALLTSVSIMDVPNKRFEKKTLGFIKASRELRLNKV